MSKNLTWANEAELENLASRSAMHRHRTGELGQPKKSCRCSWCDERHGGDYFPYRRVNRYLASRVGQHWNKIVHDFVHLDWIPPEHRKFSKLADLVEVNTFIEDGKVKYHASSFRGVSAQVVDEAWGEVFYVHPKSKTLCHKPRNSRVHYGRRQSDELATWFVKLADYDQLIKLDGIWYHVWADPQNPRVPKAYDPNRPLIYDEKEKKKFFYGPFDPRWNEYLYFRPPVYKVQLNHTSLKRYGLQNENRMPVWNICKVCGGNNCSIHHTHVTH